VASKQTPSTRPLAPEAWSGDGGVWALIGSPHSGLRSDWPEGVAYYSVSEL